MNNVIQLPKKKKKRDAEYYRLFDCKKYYMGLILTMNQENKNSTESLFSGMSNGLYIKHPQETRDLFLSFYNSPSSKSWALIRDFLVDQKTTSWRVWGMYSANSPKRLLSDDDYSKYPDPEDFVRYYN